MTRQNANIKDLEKISKEVSMCPYFVKAAYYNRLNMLSYKLNSKSEDSTYISVCINGIVDSMYRDIFGTIYVPNKKQPPYKKLEEERNFKMIVSGINQFTCLSLEQRKDYLKTIVPRIEIRRIAYIRSSESQKQRI